MKFSAAALAAVLTLATAAPNHVNPRVPPPPPPPPSLGKGYPSSSGKEGYAGQSKTASGWIPLNLSPPPGKPQVTRPSSPARPRPPPPPPLPSVEDEEDIEYDLEPLPPPPKKVTLRPPPEKGHGPPSSSQPPPPAAALAPGPRPAPSGGKCTPATYACTTNPKSGTPGWKVCDTSGSFVVSAPLDLLNIDLASTCTNIKVSMPETVLPRQCASFTSRARALTAFPQTLDFPASKEASFRLYSRSKLRWMRG